MSFERIPTIGTKGGDTASHPTNPDHLRHHPTVISHVLQNLMVEHCVKALVAEGQQLAWSDHHTPRPSLRPYLVRALQFNLNTVNVGGVATESLSIHSKTTAHVK